MFMKSHEVLKAACRKVGCKTVAAELKVSLALVHKWTSARPDGRVQEWNPLDRVAHLQKVTGDVRLVQWLCEQAGGVFVPNPPVKALRKPVDLVAGEHAVQRSFADFDKAMMDALEQPESRERRERLRAAWCALKSHGEWLVRMMEQPMVRTLVCWFCKYYLPYDAMTPGGLI
jgi:hypothetical protein